MITVILFTIVSISGDKTDVRMFGFILIIICLISGLFSCLVNVISKQGRKAAFAGNGVGAPIGPEYQVRKRFLDPEVVTRGAPSSRERRSALDANAEEEEDDDDVGVSSSSNSSRSIRSHHRCDCYSATAIREDILY